MNGSLRRGKPLAELIDGSRTVFLPGSYDALSALLVEEAGFELAYIGSSTSAASSYGLPDVGAVTLDELARAAKAAANAITIPLIADAEGGFLEPANIWRTVRAFEDAGVAGIHIEDHAGSKHTELGKRLIPLEQMLQKLRAAREARRDPHFEIIARTDAIWTHGDVGEAIRRMQAFAQLGCNFVFPTFATPAMLKEIRQAVGARILVIDLPQVKQFSEWFGLADIVLNYGFCIYAAAKGVKTALARVGRRPASTVLDDLLETSAEFESRLGYDAYVDRARRYSSFSTTKDTKYTKE
jgi:methylisocitrate lyase